ncbi:class I SAM-dependent methyltransferase [Rheinheimera sp. YQF-2]|uniref:Ribosomal RNA small subunit methyltransferase J n=1 Tax=Rheinheimera lutimaris TaxID=2740584 RepID=A0A7Y5EI53_9GAMM|nr:class I SAM-dependent methyltransferase [Rheinheimera lutimaris]NRQ43170.1 class I SAM-dependent methyltransferase [Rheinheimera lutimaris]
MSLNLLSSPRLSADYAASLCQQFGLNLVTAAGGWHLAWQDDALVLRHSDLPKQGDICVDFAGGAASHRRQYGGGKSEAIAKACGLHKKRDLTILDATAGLGRDAFVLASLGATVTMVERNPAVAALLYDGLRRGKQSAELSWLAERMKLVHSVALDALQQQPAVDVVYLDPMFPPRDKSALVKKEMRAFHDVVGSDDDADALLAPALKLAQKRVVVKRPGYAGFLAGVAPTMAVTGKNNRFDVYINAAI